MQKSIINLMGGDNGVVGVIAEGEDEDEEESSGQDESNKNNSIKKKNESPLKTAPTALATAQAQANTYTHHIYISQQPSSERIISTTTELTNKERYDIEK